MSAPINLTPGTAEWYRARAKEEQGSGSMVTRYNNFIGIAEAIDFIRSEAVERGFAEWVPDKEGNTTFKWKEVAK